MSKKTYLLLFLFLVPAAAFAGKKEGVMSEYRALEEAIRGRQRSTEARDKTLQENLIRAIRNLVVRMRYEEREALIKELTPEAMQYENPTSPVVYYVKFKTFIVRLDFARDPELYSQTPMYEKVLVSDDAGPQKPEPKADKPTTPEKK